MSTQRLNSPFSAIVRGTACTGVQCCTVVYSILFKFSYENEMLISAEIIFQIKSLLEVQKFRTYWSFKIMCNIIEISRGKRAVMIFLKELQFNEF